jgi:hypothetical protein
MLFIPLSRDGFAVRTRRARVRVGGAQDPSICGEDDALRASLPRDGTHQPLPFAKTSSEAECARFVVAEPRCDLVTLAALRVVRVSIVPARYEDVRGERVVVGFHCGEFIFDFENRLRQLLECVVKPVWLHVFI